MAKRMLVGIPRSPFFPKKLADQILNRTLELPSTFVKSTAGVSTSILFAKMPHLQQPQKWTALDHGSNPRFLVPSFKVFSTTDNYDSVSLPIVNRPQSPPTAPPPRKTCRKTLPRLMDHQEKWRTSPSRACSCFLRRTRMNWERSITQSNQAILMKCF